MDFQALVKPAGVALEAGVATRARALERVAGLLAASAGLDETMLLDALLAREQLGTTGFGGGTAIPHGRIGGLADFHGAVLLLTLPVDWSAVDGRPVDLVVAMVGPETAGAVHLKLLARVSRLLRDTAFVEKLRGATDAGALWAMLGEGPARRAA